MRTRSKLLLAGLTVALAFGAFISTSSANRLAVSGRQWRATWNKLRFVGTFAIIECHVTIEGSFHSSTISKVLEALVGYVTRVTVDSSNCTGGSARALTESLPWHVRYGGFSGTLPAISGVNLRVVGGKFLVQLRGSGTNCLFTSTASSPMKGIVAIGAGGVAENLRPDETAPIPFTTGTGGSLGCGTGRLEAASNSLTEGPGGPSIRVTLVA